MTKREVILASQSPRRKELLRQSVLEFSVQAAHIDERKIEKQILGAQAHIDFGETAKLLVETLAKEKANAILRVCPQALVIGADTIVVQGNQVLGKPVNEREAYAMIRSYAGNTHSVMTGVSIQTNTKKETFSVETKVHFLPWSSQMEKEVSIYVASGSPLDKAGAYGIQEMPALWIRGIEGDYPNVVGFPIAAVHQALQHFIE